jgi:hypothetical protein
MLSNYKITKIEKNLNHFMCEALKNEATTMGGLMWYKDANSFCRVVSKKYGIPTFTVASVVSALSPRNKWEQNLKDAVKVIEAFQAGVSPESIKVCTFHKNKFKAFDILEGKKEIEFSSRKTYSFVKNISELNNDFVTVDVWHIRACFNKMIIKKSLTPKEYDQIVKVTKKVAEENGFFGYEFQAVVWEQIRSTFVY